MPKTESSRQTRDQERAAAAWEATPSDPSDEYVSLVRGAGASIMTMGLGQTLAVYQAKGEKHHQQIADARAAWLLSKSSPGESSPGESSPGETDATGAKLMEDITKRSSRWYRRRTSEALAYLTWLKRFAEANHS